MSSMPRSFQLITGSFFSVLVACGGISDASDSGADSSPNDGALGADGGRFDSGSEDAGLGNFCPKNQPTQGAACSLATLQCEYGSDPRVSCNVVATCNSSHQWMVVATDLFCSTDGGAACPAKQADVPVGQSCSPLNLLCEYPDGLCGCTRIAHQYDRWVCDKPNPQCPYPRPRLGTACTQDQQSCDYGSCTALGGIVEKCVGGTWHQENFGCPP